MKENRITKWIVNCFLVIVSLAAVLLAFEGFFRLLYPSVPWPGYAYYPEIGILHDKNAPGINSFGFYDKERTIDKPADVYRVLLLGDSFVDGTPCAERLQDTLAQQSSGKRIEVIPMGISGTGTVNELAFYERLGRLLKPDLVVVLFVPNDFANNSSILEAIRLRFDPYRPGRPFLDKIDGQITRIPPAPDFESKLLAELPSHPQQGILRIPEQSIDRLMGSSVAYNFLKSKIYAMDPPSLYHRFDGEYAYRLCQLRHSPKAAEALKGWYFPKDLDVDAMFLADGDNLPAAFHDALDYTQYSLSEFKKLSQQDGFNFLLVATDSCTYFPESWLMDWRERGKAAKRTINPENFISRLRTVAQGADVNFLDLYPGFAKLNDIRTAHLPDDNHWSDKGYKLAGVLIAEDVKARGWLQ